MDRTGAEEPCRGWTLPGPPGMCAVESADPGDHEKSKQPAHRLVRDESGKERVRENACEQHDQCHCPAAEHEPSGRLLGCAETSAELVMLQVHMPKPFFFLRECLK